VLHVFTVLPASPFNNDQPSEESGMRVVRLKLGLLGYIIVFDMAFKTCRWDMPCYSTKTTFNCLCLFLDCYYVVSENISTFNLLMHG